MKRIGITGGIGSGKSALRQLLAHLSFPCFDADFFAREILECPIESKKIAEIFGPSILAANGLVDRAVLREIVFVSGEKRRLLEQFMHPKISARWHEVAKRFELCPVDTWVFYEAALLIETNRRSDFDKLVLVTAPEESRWARLEGRGMSVEGAKAVALTQLSDAEKAESADYILSNSGDLNDLKTEVMKLLFWLGDEFAALSS